MTIIFLKNLVCFDFFLISDWFLRCAMICGCLSKNCIDLIVVVFLLLLLYIMVRIPMYHLCRSLLLLCWYRCLKRPIVIVYVEVYN